MDSERTYSWLLVAALLASCVLTTVAILGLTVWPD